jgi:hypothetical protein
MKRRLLYGLTLGRSYDQRRCTTRKKGKHMFSCPFSVWWFLFEETMPEPRLHLRKHGGANSV